MTQSVYHTGYEIALNLSRHDLGHPSHPGLWEEIYRHYQPGVLLCMECLERDPGCPQYMYVKIARGRRFACHINTGIRHASENESPRHKALKERIAAAAEHAGYRAVLEDRGPGGLRITDVLIRGADGILVGCEVQFSYITSDAVLSRSDLARQDGITPMWTVDDVKAAPIDRAPWTRIDPVPWELIASGRALVVRGGVRSLRMERCNKRRATPCPERGRGRCGKWHGRWVPALGLRLDDVVCRAGAGEFVPLYQPAKTRSGWWMWVTPADKDEFLQGRPEPEPSHVSAGPGGIEAEGPAENPQPLDPACHYGEESGIRERPRARDTGADIDASAWLTRDTDVPAPPVRLVNGLAVPEDLIGLRRQFDRLQQVYRQAAADLPGALDLVQGKARKDPEASERWRLAQARSTRAALALQAHPWWAQTANRYRADQAVRQAARDPGTRGNQTRADDQPGQR